MCVTKFNTLLRMAYTLGVYLILSQSAFAQSSLNFAKATANERFSPGFSVINPTSNYADVQFTYYGLDGNPVSSGLVNPVRYRVSPKGQIAMRASELFAGSRADGWVQVTSATSGLIGAYLSGDFATTLEGADAAPALTVQTVPVIRDDAAAKTELIIVNPGSASSTVVVSLFNARGDQIGTVPSQFIASHGALRLSSTALNVTNAGLVSARITASAAVAATAVIDRGDSLLFVNGQPVDQPASLRIASHFTTSGGADPVLILANPTASAVTVTATIYTESGSLIFPSSASSRSFTIPANGLLSADSRTITGQPIAPTVNGWLRVDSPSVALAGVLVHDQGRSVTSIPLQPVATDRMIFSQIFETESVLTALVLVNPSGADAQVDVNLVGTDGATSARAAITVPANTKFTDLVRNVLPDAAGRFNGYLVLRSSTPLYGFEMIGAQNSAFLASLPPGRPPDSFAPGSILAVPTILRVDPGTDVVSGSTVRVSLLNAPVDPVFMISGQTASSRQLGPISPIYEVSIPALETGFVNLTVRGNGLESPSVVLRVLPNDNGPVQIISGAAFYQKIDVTDAGLDLTHPMMTPIRSARVEVFSRSSQSIVAVSETDSRGRFSVPVPFDANLTVRVLSRLRSNDIRVADNTNQGQVYVISADIDGRVARSDVVLADNTRMSGAFNILEMIKRSNDLLETADPNLVPPSLAIFWSSRNAKGAGIINIGQGLIGTTYFNVSTNTAYVLGDRSDDSDEYDDAVIIHEYAHLLASKFSRDDSPGGSHSLGDMLDPRVSWSEGWANFFASAVRNDAIWRDSRGPNGATLLRYDLEDNVPAGDSHPGYWSEASVDTILWDLYDDHADTADDVQFPFAQIWAAFTDLRTDRFVYLPYFLEHFIARAPASADAVRQMVQSRSIEFQPNVRPSVTYPFPSPMSVGASVTGTVDSLSTRRNNLVTSSHFYSFTTNGGAATIRLDITGLGPGENGNANDLDLFLMDASGRMIDRSDSGLNGQSERIATKLDAGTYVVEIRSFYTRAETGGFVFNSGQYRLNVTVQ